MDSANQQPGQQRPASQAPDAKQNMKAVYVAVGIVVIIALWQMLAMKKAGAPQQQVPQNTNAQELSTESDVELITADVKYFESAIGYHARPKAEGSYPGVVMIHENRGLNDGIRMIARQLASEGYNVLAVDLLGPSVETQEEARALTAKFDRPKGVENMRAAAKFLRDTGSTKVGSIGWCFGGGQSLALALSGEQLDATVLYYGTPLVTDKAQLDKIEWPVLGIFGDQDQAISVDSVKQFDAALDELKVTNEIYIYPGVGHAFANPSRPSYAPTETKDAWEKTTMFLEKNLK